MVTSDFDLKMTCTWVGRSVGINGPLLGITVNSCPMSRGGPSVDSKAKLKLISNLPLFLREQVCLVSSNTLRTPKSRPPSAPMRHMTWRKGKELYSSVTSSHAAILMGDNVNWNGFSRRGENRSTREKPLRAEKRSDKLNPLWRRVWAWNPGHIDGRRVLLPLRHHCSPQDKQTSVSKCKWCSMVSPH